MRIKELAILSQLVAMSVVLITPHNSAAVPYEVTGTANVVAQAMDGHFKPDEMTLN